MTQRSTDPFAPPDADLLSRPVGAITRRDTVDIMAAMRYPFQNPSWLADSLLAGVITFIPVAGLLALFGWQKRLAAEVAEGRESAPPTGLRFGDDLSAGIQPFLAFFLNMFAAVTIIVVLSGALIGVSVAVGAGVEGATDGSGAGGVVSLVGMILGYGLIMVFSLALNLVMPELMRRVFRGEWAPFLNPFPSIAAMRRHPGPLVMTILGMFAINMVAALGVFVCYVGMLLTMPLAQVMLAHLYGQWAAVVGDGAGDDATGDRF